MGNGMRLVLQDGWCCIAALSMGEGTVEAAANADIEMWAFDLRWPML